MRRPRLFGGWVSRKAIASQPKTTAAAAGVFLHLWRVFTSLLSVIPLKILKRNNFWSLLPQHARIAVTTMFFGDIGISISKN